MDIDSIVRSEEKTMPDKTGDATNASEERGIARQAGFDRRALFSAISNDSLGLAATAAIAEQILGRQS
jgi:hypothetical protein